MEVKYINPFITGSKSVLQQLMGVTPQVAQPRLLDNSIDGNDIVVIVGLTGEISGQVMFTMSEDTALRIARKMTYNNALSKLDYISESAISEIGNMISGASGMEMYSKGIIINITPPTLCRGGAKVFSSKNKFVSVPLKLDSYGELLINISFEKQEK